MDRMDLLLKDITVQVDSKFDVKLRSLTNENKELFLSSKFERFRAEEIERQNDSLVCQVEMLENIIEERRRLRDQDHSELFEKYKVQLQRFKDEIEAQKNKMELVQEQLKEALQTEACLRNKINEQEMAIEGDLAGKKLEFVERECDELIKRLRKKEEQLVTKELQYKTHELDCPQVKADLEKKCEDFEKEIAKLKIAMEKESDDWSAKKIEMQKEITKKGLEVESEIFNTKMQVSAVEEQKKKAIQVAEQRVTKYKDKNKKLYKAFKEKEQDLQKSLLDLAKFEVEKLSLNNQVQEKDRKVTFLYQRLNKVDEVFESNKSMKLKCKKLQDEYKKMKEKFQKSEEKRRQLQQGLTSNVDQDGQSKGKEELQDRITDLKSEIRKLKSENAKLVSSKTEVSDSRERLRNELEEFQRKCKDQEERLEKQQKEFEKQKKEIQELNNVSKSKSHTKNEPVKSNIESSERATNTKKAPKESLVAEARYSDDSFEDSSKSAAKSISADSNQDDDINSIGSEIAEEVAVDNSDCSDEVSGDFFGNNNVNFFLPNEEIEEDIKMDSSADNEVKQKNSTTKTQVASTGSASTNKLQRNQTSKHKNLFTLLSDLTQKLLRHKRKIA